MSSQDSRVAAAPGTSLVLMLTGLGAVMVVVGVIALVATDPINWVGVGLAWFAGVYSLVMAQVVKRRQAKASS